MYTTFAATSTKVTTNTFQAQNDSFVAFIHLFIHSHFSPIISFSLCLFSTENWLINIYNKFEMKFLFRSLDFQKISRFSQKLWRQSKHRALCDIHMLRFARGKVSRCTNVLFAFAFCRQSGKSVHCRTSKDFIFLMR